MNGTADNLPGYYDSVFMFNKDKIGEGENAPVISAIYLYGGNNTTHDKPIDGDVTIEESTTENGCIKYTFSGTGAISLW